MEGPNSGYDPVLVSDSFISSEQHSNLSTNQMTLQSNLTPQYTEYTSQSSASGKEKSSSEDEPATEFTSFLDEDEDRDLSGLNFLQDLDKQVTASCGTLNNELKPTSTEQSQIAGVLRQLHNAYAASSEFVQAGSGQMTLPHTKGKSCFCSSLEVTVSGSPYHMSPKKAALRRIWMNCELRSFPNGRKIRALAELAEISSKTARKWLTEFIRLGLYPLSGQQVEQPVKQPLQATCVARHGRPTSPFQPRNIERKYICIDCHHTFKRKDDWIKHTSLNYVQSYWQCLDCEYRCAAKRSDKLRRHFEIKHFPKRLAVDAAIHYRQIDGPFEKQCGFCGHTCKSFGDFTGHVSRHFEDSTADPPYDMRIWRDPWTTDKAEHPDHSEDDDDDPDDSNQEDGQDEDGDNQDFDAGNEQTDDNQDSRPGGSGSDYFSNYPADDGFWDGCTSFDQWANWRSLQEHKKHRHLTSEWAQHNRHNMDSAKKLSTDPCDKPWSTASQTPHGKSEGRVFPPFGILGRNSGLRQIRLDRGPTVAPHDTQGSDVKARRDSWTSDEDERLLSLLDMLGTKNWIRIAEYMPKKSPRQCRQRYHQNLKLEAPPETVVRLPGGLCGADMRSPHSKYLQKVYTVQLDGTVVDGDCRSLVLHRANGDLYGHIIAGSSGTGTAYVSPATQVFEDLEQRLGGAASLPTRDGLPSLRQQDTLFSPIVAEISRPNNPNRFYIRDAARATSAAPTFFQEADVNGKVYIDGGLNANNPTRWAWDEAWNKPPERYQPPERYLVLVSVGTGFRAPQSAFHRGDPLRSIRAQRYIKRDTSADSGTAVGNCGKQKDLDSVDNPWNKGSDRLIKTEARMNVSSMWGWSAGDLLQLARFAKAVFDYDQSAPQNLRQSLQRSQDVANRLEELADMLQIFEWPSYDRAPNLRATLEDAKRFIDRYAPLSAATTASASRLFDTACPRLDRGRSKLRGIDENLKDHLGKMSAFKQHAIL